MAKYKVGDKFEIEIAHKMDGMNGPVYQMKGFNNLALDEAALNKLKVVNDVLEAGNHKFVIMTKDAYDNALKEAYNNGYKKCFTDVAEAEEDEECLEDIGLKPDEETDNSDELIKLIAKILL